MKNNIIPFLQKERIDFQENINLKNKTWIKRGGIADIWIQPNSTQKLERLIKYCHDEKIIYELIGSTSNCYFLNNYNPNIIITTLHLNTISMHDNYIICECGVKTKKLTKFCIENGISGYEGFTDLPGTVGGAVVNNSGCYGSLISDLVSSVDILVNGKKKIMSNSELNYSHRNSIIKSGLTNGVILTIKFINNTKEKKSILKSRATEFKKIRRSKNEFTYPSLGSTLSNFKFKKSSFFIRIIGGICNRLVKILIKNRYKQLALQTKVFLLLRNTKSFRNYISPLGIHSFLWKDKNADIAFIKYKKFIEKNTINHTFEIEIKGDIE